MSNAVAIHLPSPLAEETAVPPRPASPAPSAPARHGDYFSTGLLGFEDRVWAQEQIERIYQQHRLWPKCNPGLRAPLAELLPAAALAARVTDSLKKSAALDSLWQQPVTPALLQEELSRICRDSRAPGVLLEIFGALRDDAFLIAQTLARQTLVNRLIRVRQQRDPALHPDTLELARALESRAAAARWRELGGVYRLRRFTPWQSAEEGEARWETVIIAAATFERLKAQLPDPGRMLPLQETATAYVLARPLEVTGRWVTIESLLVPKQGFEAWWELHAPLVSLASAPERRSGLWQLPPLGNSRSTVQNGDWDGWADRIPNHGLGQQRVWTGTELLAWGGIGIHPVRPSGGGRYDPAVDQWTDFTPPGDPPAAMRGHSAVWTGREMILWGGAVEAELLPRGGLSYSPAADRWATPATTGAAPAARAEHSAVWTGTEMIVWGGQGNAGPLGDGAGYDPRQDAWHVCSMAGAPLARRGHSVVWTGREMIVWGGVDARGEVLQDGGSHDPIGGRWSPVPYSLDAPLARYQHSAIWNGQEMIIWGGGTPDGMTFNAGARYQPNTAVWHRMRAPRAPSSGRKRHLAHWSGRGMLIRGGQTADMTGQLVEIDAPDLYDPARDRWQSDPPEIVAPVEAPPPAAVPLQQKLMGWLGAGKKH